MIPSRSRIWTDILAQALEGLRPAPAEIPHRVAKATVRRTLEVDDSTRKAEWRVATRWASGPDLSMMADAGVLDPIHETFREYERVVNPKYLEQIRSEAKQFSTKRLSRQSRLAECATRNFKNGKNSIRPRSLPKLTRAIQDLQNRELNLERPLPKLSLLWRRTEYASLYNRSLRLSFG